MMIPTVILADPPSDAPRSIRWSVHHWIAVAAILMASMSVGWWSRAPEVSIGGDEATYIILSHSIDQARYNDEFLLGTPPHAKYPPGTPVWIALIRWVAGSNLDAVRAANIVLLALTGLLLGDGVRRLAGPWPGVAGVALTSLSPPLLELSGTALSEAPFVFLATASVWAALRADEHPSGWTVVAMVTALGSFLVRTIGFTVVAGILVWLALRKRWHWAIRSLLIGLVTMGGWFAYTAHAGSATIGQTYAGDFRIAASTGRAGLPGFIAQSLFNAEEYLVRGLPLALRLPTIPGTILDNVFWLVVVGSSAVVGMFLLARRWPAFAAYLVLSGGVLLVWPWPVERLLAPLVPGIIAAFLVGFDFVARPVGQNARTVLLLVLGFVVCGSGVNSYIRGDRNHACDRRDPYADPRCFFPEGRSMVTAAHRVRDSLWDRAVIATSKPATVFYFGNHLTVPLGRLLQEERKTGVLDLRSLGADLVLLSRLLPSERTTARRMLKRHCRELEVYASIPPATLLIKPKDRGPDHEDACAALADYALEPSIP